MRRTPLLILILCVAAVAGSPVIAEAGYEVIMSHREGEVEKLGHEAAAEAARTALEADLGSSADLLDHLGVDESGLTGRPKYEILVSEHGNAQAVFTSSQGYLVEVAADGNSASCTPGSAGRAVRVYPSERSRSIFTPEMFFPNIDLLGPVIQQSESASLTDGVNIKHVQHVFERGGLELQQVFHDDRLRLVEMRSGGEWIASNLYIYDPKQHKPTDLVPRLIMKLSSSDKTISGIKLTLISFNDLRVSFRHPLDYLSKIELGGALVTDQRSGSRRTFRINDVVLAASGSESPADFFRSYFKTPSVYNAPQKDLVLAQASNPEFGLDDSGSQARTRSLSSVFLALLLILGGALVAAAVLLIGSRRSKS